MAPATANIPVIDITSAGGDEQSIARKLVDAAAENGFIYVRSTGDYIDNGDIQRIFDTSRQLFQAPVEEKATCKIQTNNRGWSGMHSETLDPKTQKVGDYKEAFNFGEFKDGKAQQPLPPTVQPNEAQINSFRDQCHRLCLRLLYLLGLGLEVEPPSFFSSAHDPSLGPSGTILRLLYYPPTSSLSTSSSSSPTTPNDVRAGAHSDYGSITLLFRLAGQAGLEILTPQNTWAPVPVLPPGTESDPSPPILVNIGDLLSYWTNGMLRSTVHRVVFAGTSPLTSQHASNEQTDIAPRGSEGENDIEARYSIAFFCHPVGTAPLDPVPSKRVEEFRAEARSGSGEGKDANPYAEKKVMTADEHLQMRLRASYLGLYDENMPKGET